jgi:ligand-binding sensor domain-containing protein
MFPNSHVRLIVAFVVCGGVNSSVLGDNPTALVSTAIELSAEPCGNGWKLWQNIGDIEGAVAHRERITALVGKGSDVWVGTSFGRLLTRHDNEWRLQGQLKGIQITGIAVEGANNVWLSTSDGIRRLERKKDQPWQVKEYRYYYEGHPSFVSGAYIPGEDAVRLWGYIDDIYIPVSETAYAPFVISTEHGLFCWGGYGRVWHHFMPHYWGASSAWLDTRELVPNRRPTCTVEDSDGNLWIGTERDGLVRLNAHARKYHDRKSDNNEKDGTEFSFIGSREVGCKFDRVVDLAASADKGVWAILMSGEDGCVLARFDGQRWDRDTLEGPARSVVELNPGVALIGVTGRQWGHDRGLRRVTWASKTIERSVGPESVIFEIIKLKDGQVFAASSWNVYESEP